MAFGRAGNRRRADVARTPEEVRATARRLGSLGVRFFVGLAALAALGAGGKYGRAWATTSPAFAAKQVSFSGQARSTPAELLRLSGLAAGQNLFALDPAALEKAMATHPWVKSAELSRRFPSTVSVRVVEHQPAAITALGDLYLLDEAGEPFKKVQAEDAVDLPLVTGIEREDYVAHPAETALRFQRALSLAKAYGELSGGKEARLSEVRLEAGRVTLVTGPGQEVLLPEGQALGQLSKLSRVREELDRRGLSAEVIHLDNRARTGWVSVRVSAARSERTGGSKR
ncbi:MAG: cell division protein FtsQ/DivIB [Myxococcaceae bacterium]